MGEKFWNTLSGIIYETKLTCESTFVMLVILKLCEVINFSWFMVCIPLYIITAMVLSVYIAYLIELKKEEKTNAANEHERERVHTLDELAQKSN